MTRRALAILRLEWVSVCVFSLLVVPFGALTSFCLIGFPIMTQGLGSLAWVLVRGARKHHQRAFEPDPPAGWAGALALSGIAALLGTTLVASGAAGAVLGADHAIAQAMAAVIAAAMAGAALAPFALAPVIAAGGEGGLVRPIGRSVELASRLGARRLAALGAAGGALVGGAFVGCAWAIGTGHPLVIAGAVLALLASPALVLALLADVYVRASSADTPSVAPPPPRRLALVLVPLLLIPAAASIVAALTPTPMRWLGEVSLREYTLRESEEDLGYAGAAIGARAYVRTVTGGVLVATPDGGGAGYIRTRFDPRTGVLSVRDGTAYGGPRGSYAVIVDDGCTEITCAAYALVDRDGVRLDDSLEDRVLGRLGPLGGGALALALVLLLVLSWRLGSSLGEARTLEAPDLHTPGEGTRKALEGTLSIASATLTPRRRSMKVEGEAWIEADNLRIRLPEGAIQVLGDLEQDLKQGQPVVLVSRFERALASNLREASAPWPDDGLLVLGTRAEARDALARRAANAAAWIILPLGACVFTATAMLLARL